MKKQVTATAEVVYEIRDEPPIGVMRPTPPAERIVRHTVEVEELADGAADITARRLAARAVATLSDSVRADPGASAEAGE